MRRRRAGQKPRLADAAAAPRQRVVRPPRRGRGTAAPPGRGQAGKLVALGYARAALAALDLAQDLSRRAGRLADAAPKLRAKGKAGAIAALLADDAVSAAAPLPGLSDRARRRLFERLVELAPRASSPAARPSGSTGFDHHGAEAKPEPDFDRELADLPPELRWREWKARVEAVLFAAAKPVTRDVLARVVGRDCALDLLLDDLKEDFAGGRSNSSGQGRALPLHTRPAFGPAVRVAFDIPADAKALTKLEAGVLMAVAMFQPVTRGEISEMFGGRSRAT